MGRVYSFRELRVLSFLGSGFQRLGSIGFGFYRACRLIHRSFCTPAEGMGDAGGKMACCAASQCRF